jgi:hypothetical protein
VNYFDARPLKDGSGWHYTCRNDGETWPVGYCRDHDGHETEVAARECYREWLLGNATFDGLVSETRRERCEVDGCDEFTGRYVGTGFGVPTLHVLCDEHHNREGLASVLPLPGQEISS